MPPSDKDNVFAFTVFSSLLLFLVLVTPALSQQAAELDNLIEKQKAIQSLTATFVQEKNSTMLKEPLISEGSFYFKTPGKVAWIYTDQVEIISNGHELTVYYPQIREAEIVPVHSSIIRLPLNFNLDELQQYFELTLTRKHDQYVVTLIPLDESSLFLKMIITLLQTGVPQTVEMFEKGGDRSIIKFSKQVINKDLSDELFNKQLPADTVIRKFQQQ